MNNKKYYLITIYVLLAINLALLAFILLRKPPHHRPGPFRFIVEQLEMSKEQEEQYRDLVDIHRKDMDGFHQEMARLRDQLYSSFGQNDSSRSPLIDSIAAMTKKTETITFEHFQKVRELCNEQQKSKFDEIIREAIRMMGPPPPPPHKP